MKSAPAIDLPYVDSYQYYLKLGPLSSINEKLFKNEVTFWNEMTKHPDYDEFWQSRDLRRHLKRIQPAVMTVGGWFDAEDLFGALPGGFVPVPPDDPDALREAVGERTAAVLLELARDAKREFRNHSDIDT